MTRHRCFVLTNRRGSEALSVDLFLPLESEAITKPHFPPWPSAHPGPLLDAARNTPPPCETIRQISPILRPNDRSCTSWHSRPPTAASWTSVSVAFPLTIPTRSLWRSTTKRLTALRFHVAFHRLQPGARHSPRDGLLSEIRSISPYVNAHIEHEVAEYRNIEVPQISASTFLKDAEELSRYRALRI